MRRRCLTPVTSKTRTGRLNPLSGSSPICVADRHRLGGVEDPLGGQHLPRSGRVAQPGGEVGDAADRGVVEATLEPDPAQGGEALGDPDRRGQVVAAARPPCRPARRTRSRMATDIRIARSGASSIGSGSLKKTISPSPVNRSSVPSYAKISSPSASWYSREDAHHLLGLARLGERREAAKVAEDHDDLPAMAAAGRSSSPESITSVDELGGEEAAQPVDPLQVLDLGLDPRLQLGVPLPQLRGLPIDRVVVALHPGQRGDPGQQLALVERLADEVVGAGLDGGELLLVAAAR